MGKSSDENSKAAKKGLCAAGICCALCIGIPLLIIIIIIIIIVVVVGNAADDITSVEGFKTGFGNASCDLDESTSGSCFMDLSCRGARTCNNDLSVCEGESGC